MVYQMVNVEIASEIQNTFLHQQKIEFYRVPIELHKYDIPQMETKKMVIWLMRAIDGNRKNNKYYLQLKR